MRGRIQERMATVARRDAPGETLEAIYLAGGPGGAVLAPPHPLYGGSLESPVLAELAFACRKVGLASLRFNWRGVGASAGRPSGGAAEADADYGSALDHLAETVTGPLVAGGYSFGSAAAVRAAGAPRVESLILVAPPPQLVAPASIAAAARRTLVLAGEYDTLAPARALASALAEAPHVTLRVVPHADHFFGEGLGEIGRLAAEWLEGA